MLLDCSILNCRGDNYCTAGGVLDAGIQKPCVVSGTGVIIFVTAFNGVLSVDTYITNTFRVLYRA